MKKTAAILLFASAFPFLAQVNGAPPAEPLTVAVLDFQASGEKFDKKGAQVGILLNALLSASPNIVLVERQEIEKILGEQELGLSGTVTADTVAKVGELTGAKVLVTGRIFDTAEKSSDGRSAGGGKIYLVAKIMSTETSRVFGETASLNDLVALDAGVNELATKIQNSIEKQAPNLVAKVEAPEERLARLKKLVEGKKLPSVSVSVAEQHLDRAVIDPAVETEMRLVLQQLGFEVLDPASSARQADVRITGEAFSEFGARRGNLVSSVARVEIKVVGEGGQLLASDRQRGVAVDLAEHVAAKEALQNAAIKLLDRLVPKLATAK